MHPLDRKMLRDLWHLRGQAAAIALVAAAGVAMYVMALGNFASLDETRRAYYERYNMPDLFATAKRAPNELTGAVAELDGVARIEARITGQAVVDLPQVVEPVRAQLMSYDPNAPAELRTLYLRTGRMIAPNRIDEAMVNEAFALANGIAPGARIAATINGQHRDLEIVGVVLSPEYVYVIAPGGIMPDAKRYGVLWLSRESLAAAYDLDGAFNYLAVNLMPTADAVPVKDAIDRLLGPYGGVGAFDRSDHYSDAFLSAEIDGLGTIGQIVPLIFLAVAGVLINIVMSRLIQTERQEIGLLKAFGYAGRSIAWHYLKLALVMASLGVAVGCLAGAWLGREVTQIYGEFFNFPFLLFRPQLQTFVIAGGATLAAAALGTVSAIRKVAQLPPAEAMAPPAPPDYGRGRVRDALLRAGLPVRAVLSLFAQTSRMILRHLARHLTRGLATVAGISLAVSMLVATLFFFDAIEVLIDVQFQVGQRQDAVISFVEPRSPEAGWRLERLPGVLAVEAFRAVPVDLVAGHRRRSVGLTGLPPRPDLHRLLDAELQPIDMPPQGLLLSAKLADLLQVNVGDWVTVEVKEGRRPVVRQRVAALADDYFGTAAYMDLAALNRMMGDGALISGADILIDPAHETAFFAAVKDIPAIATVQMQSTTLRLFRETMAEGLYISVFFYVAFAAVLAVGVVYNSARIALSERARELATLRVLGFTRAEVSYILLGELAVLTLLAMPVGCLLGYGFASAIIEAYRTDLMRIPLIVETSTYAVSVLIVLFLTALSALLVRHRVDRLNLVAVLKTRE